MKRVLITGSRNWEDRVTIETALQQVQAEAGITRDNVVVVHGGARGADRMAGWIAEQLGMKVEVHPADWERHGKAAGFIRNQEMVDADIDLVLSFNRDDSAGTRQCTRLAENAGLEIRRFTA